MTKMLAYYGKGLITTIERFIAPRGQCYTTF